MASSPNKTEVKLDDIDELFEDDDLLKDTLIELVNNITKNELLAESLLRLKHIICASTNSLSRIPKPLKYLRDYYLDLKMAFIKLDDCQEQLNLADIISVLALAFPSSQLDCLRFCLDGTQDIGQWGSEYITRLHIEIDEEWSKTPNHFMPFFKKLLEYDKNNNLEIDACDLCLEVSSTDLITHCVDQNNYKKIYLYLINMADYTEDPENFNILMTLKNICLSFNDFSRAVLASLQIPDINSVRTCFMNCHDLLLRRQLAFIMSRMRDIIFQELYTGNDANEITNIMNNCVTGLFYLRVAERFRKTKPKSLDHLFKNRRIERKSSYYDVGACLASSFVHVGYKFDPMIKGHRFNWFTSQHNVGKFWSTATLGLTYYWDLHAGLNAIVRYLHVSDIFLKSGALLAVGILYSSGKDDSDPAKSILSDYLESDVLDSQISSILGLGMAYAGTCRKDINELILVLFDENNTKATCEVIAIASLSLGLVNVGSKNRHLCYQIVTKYFTLNKKLLSPYTRYLFISLGLIYMCCGDESKRMMDHLLVLPRPLSDAARLLIKMCAFAGTNNHHEVKEMLEVVTCPPSPPDDKTDSSNEEHNNYILYVQPIATIGAAIVGLGEGDENHRLFRHISSFGNVQCRKAAALAMGLTHLSTADPTAINALVIRSHDYDMEVAMNAVLAIGLVGAGTNNPNIKKTLNRLASYHAKNASVLFTVHISQGLLRLGKGLLTLNCLKFTNKIIDKVALASLIIVLFAFVDINIIQGRFYLIFCLALAIEPRWLITLNENNQFLPVQVRVGQAVDVVGKVGEPKTITGGRVSTTPVLLDHKQRAELLNKDEYEPLVDPMQGFVILRPKK